MRLRTKLAIAFALFAAVPLAAALVPVSRALSDALSAEHAARLDGAVRALDGELARLAREAAATIDELARGPDAEALARDLASGAVSPADAAVRAREWMEARGLDVLAVAEPDGRIVSSGHLPGRAGDVDPDVAALLATAPGRAAPRVVARAAPEGVEPVLAVVAWAPVPGDAPLRLAGGLALGRERAARLAALTGGEIAIRAADGALLAEAAAPAQTAAPARRGTPAAALDAAPDLASRLSARLGALGAPARATRARPAGRPRRHGRGPPHLRGTRARATRRRSRRSSPRSSPARSPRPRSARSSPRESRAPSRRSAPPRCASPRATSARASRRAPTGEVGELVRAFNGMTGDLAASRTSARTGRARRRVARGGAAARARDQEPAHAHRDERRDAPRRARARPPRLRRDLRRGHAGHRRGGPAAEAHRRRVQPVRAAARARADPGRSRRARPVGARAVPRAAGGRDRRARARARAAPPCSPIAIRCCRCS